jgi:hypothetical protein
VSELQLGRFQERGTAFSALQQAHADAAIANDMGVVQLRRPGQRTEGQRTVPRSRERSIRTIRISSSILATRMDRARISAGHRGRSREVVRRNPADDDAHYVLGATLQASGAAEEGAREKELARRLSSVYSELDARRTAQLGAARASSG